MPCSLHVLAWPNRRSCTDPISLTAPVLRHLPRPVTRLHHLRLSCPCCPGLLTGGSLSCMGKYPYPLSLWRNSASHVVYAAGIANFRIGLPCAVTSRCFSVGDRPTQGLVRSTW